MNLKYKHYFEALPPKIPMEKFEVFYPHPTRPIQVNEFGYPESKDPNIVFYDPDKPGFYAIRVPGGIQIAKWTKINFLFSCYHNLQRSPRVILFLDGNPYNCTKSNLIGVNYATPELMLTALKNTNDFITNTVAQIPVMIKKYSEYWSANDVVDNFKIPREYIEFWQHPKKLKQFFEENEKAVEISIRRKIYKRKLLNYGIPN